MAQETKLKEWQIPRADAKEDTKLSWLNSAVEEGSSWLKEQRGYADMKTAFDILAGKSPANPSPSYRSQMSTGRLKRNIREIVGAVSNVRPIWGYNTSNNAFTAECEMMNKVTQALYLERGLDTAIKSAMQWSAATCTGWLRPVFRKSMYGTKRTGDLTFLTYGAPSVLPVQLPSNNDWQEAYAITILDELPIAMAHGMFPKFQDRLTPTSSRYWYAPEIRRAAKGNVIRRMFGKWGQNEARSLSEMYIPIRYTYIIDLAINTTGKSIAMGQPADASWCYTVPSLNSDIPIGRHKDGSVIYKKADENDARMYPYRRLIISSENVVMYDGPSFDWHGEFPAIPFCLDSWAWEAIGFALVNGGWQIQKSIDELERGVMDKHAAALDPALAYDINAVNRNEARTFDPMKPRTRCGFDGQLTERPFQDVLPESYRRVDPATPQYITHLEETMDYQQAIRDVLALAKARALGGGVNDYEKLVEADGPIVQDITRNVENSLSRVGHQTKYHVMQYYDTKRLMEYVGADGITRSTLDYDPTSLVPSHMPDEDRNGSSIYSRLQRARMFAENLHFYLTPHSAHEITQMSHKLLLIQLRKAGIQIDSRTIAESCNVSNFGNKPDGNTVWDRYWNEQARVAEHAIGMKQLVDSLMSTGVGTTPAIDNAAANLAGAPTSEGRPPSGQQSPKLLQKDGGTRSTISESGT
jgi:hypothetical protein